MSIAPRRRWRRWAAHDPIASLRRARSSPRAWRRRPQSRRCRPASRRRSARSPRRRSIRRSRRSSTCAPTRTLIGRLMFSQRRDRVPPTPPPIADPGHIARIAPERQEEPLRPLGDRREALADARDHLARRALRGDPRITCSHDERLIAYGEECRDWGGAFGVYRGLVGHPALSPAVQLADLGGRDRRHRGRLRAGRRPRAGRADVCRLHRPRRRRDLQPDGQVAGDVGGRAASCRSCCAARSAANTAPSTRRTGRRWSPIFPGLKVVYPATPYDAKGLMASALVGRRSGGVLREPAALRHAPSCSTQGGVPADYYRDSRSASRTSSARAATSPSSPSARSLYPALDAARELAGDLRRLAPRSIDARSLVPFDYDRSWSRCGRPGGSCSCPEASERGSFAMTLAANVTRFAFGAPEGAAARPRLAELDRAGRRHGSDLLPPGRRHRRRGLRRDVSRTRRRNRRGVRNWDDIDLAAAA